MQVSFQLARINVGCFPHTAIAQAGAVPIFEEGGGVDTDSPRSPHLATGLCGVAIVFGEPVEGGRLRACARVFDLIRDTSGSFEQQIPTLQG